MALSRGNLGPVQVVPASGGAVGVVTVASNKNVYVKSIIAHIGSGSGIGTAQAAIHVCPNGVSASDANRVFKVDIAQLETVLIEPSYPIVLENTGDCIKVDATTSTVNILVNGDKEA